MISASVYSEPGGVTHFAQTDADPVLVEISGFGPTDTRYFDPANTPKTPAFSDAPAHPRRRPCQRSCRPGHAADDDPREGRTARPPRVLTDERG